MAKLIGPLHSTEARGVIGGIIFNTWRGVRYCKRMTSPCQPRTKRALYIRSLAVRLVRHWRTLSAGNRGLWNDYATAHPLIDWTGVAKRATGCNWFTGLNLRLLDLAESIVDTPPLVAAPAPPAAFEAADGIGQSMLSWESTGGTNLTLDYWFVGPHSAGLNAPITRARHYRYCTGESGAITHIAPQPGVYTFFARIISEDDGQASPWVSDTAVVSAAP